MIQSIEVEEPIPSLPVHKVMFRRKDGEGSWSYIYTFETPAKLTKRNRKEPFYFSAGLHSMRLIEECPKNTTNLFVRSVLELIELLDAQRSSDCLFRERFEAEHVDDDLSESVFVLDNKTQVLDGSYIVRVKEQKDDSTVFVGRY